MLICITHSRDQPPLKSTLFQLKVYANIRPLKISKWEMCIQLFLDYNFDKDKYKLSLEFDIAFLIFSTYFKMLMPVQNKTAFQLAFIKCSITPIYPIYIIYLPI